MTDLLVKLYALPPAPELSDIVARGIVVRRAMVPEMRAAANWVAGKFGDGWSSEVAVAFARQPVSCFIAAEQRRLVGFSCYDATARGFFGPAGVEESARGSGLGRALLFACLMDMREQGYGYAVIGGAGPVAFYEKAVGATIIPDSHPGIYPRLIQPP